MISETEKKKRRRSSKNRRRRKKLIDLHQLNDSKGSRTTHTRQWPQTTISSVARLSPFSGKIPRLKTFITSFMGESNEARVGLESLFGNNAVTHCGLTHAYRTHPAHARMRTFFCTHRERELDMNIEARKWNAERGVFEYPHEREQHSSAHGTGTIV
jgi:hypothetical protein